MAVAAALMDELRRHRIGAPPGGFARENTMIFSVILTCLLGSFRAINKVNPGAGAVMRNSLVVALFVAVGAGPGWANPIPIERFSYTYITPSGADFSGSSFFYTNTVNFDTGAGILGGTLNFRPVAFNIVLYGQGATTITPTSVPDHTPLTAISMVSPGGPGQGYGFDYLGLASTVPGASFIMPGVVGGRNALTFSGGGTGTVANGARFVSIASITGDFSSPLLHTGLSFSPGYVLDENFTFSGGQTRVVVETNDYIGVDPNLSFSLLGGAVAVPEPASFAIVSMTLLGLVYRRQRRS